MNEQQIEELKQRVLAQENKKDTHTPYEQILGHIADFEVAYEFDISSEIESIMPFQGMRCDFLYEGDKPSSDGIHMIWPELQDKNNNIILDKRVTLETKGLATMWICQHEARMHIHQKRIKVGTVGYWVIGTCRLAKVKVTKVIGLFTNTE